MGRGSNAGRSGQMTEPARFYRMDVMLKAPLTVISGRTFAVLAPVEERMWTAFTSIRAMLALWAQRMRERDEMRSMDPAERRELSLSPGEVSRETDKWFWQK